MTRVKRSVHARKKRRATLERAKGYRGEAHSSYRRAKEAVMKADSYAYRDRRNRKRDFRRLWITRINAAARQNGMTLRHVHARPQAGRHRDRPQGPRRHRRARRRHVPPICRGRPRGVAGLTADDTSKLPGAPPLRTGALFVSLRCPSPAPTTNAQGGPQARRPQVARQDAHVRRRGRGPDRGRRRGGLGAGAAAERGRLRARRARRSRRTCSSRSPSSARARARSRSTRSAGRRRPPGRSASRCGASTTPATSAPCCASALAFGAGSVALGPGTADPYGPKAVRASMGAIFDVPVVRVDEHRRAARAQGRARRPQPAARWPRSSAQRGDARGRRRARGPAGGRRSASCNETAHIPIRSESLNAAMAATIGALRSH